jgi:hypothetical protein
VSRCDSGIASLVGFAASLQEGYNFDVRQCLSAPTIAAPQPDEYFQVMSLIAALFVAARPCVDILGCPEF